MGRRVKNAKNPNFWRGTV